MADNRSDVESNAQHVMSTAECNSQRNGHQTRLDGEIDRFIHEVRNA